MCTCAMLVSLMSVMIRRDTATRSHRRQQPACGSAMVGRRAMSHRFRRTRCPERWQMAERQVPIGSVGLLVSGGIRDERRGWLCLLVGGPRTRQRSLRSARWQAALRSTVGPQELPSELAVSCGYGCRSGTGCPAGERITQAPVPFSSWSLGGPPSATNRQARRSGPSSASPAFEVSSARLLEVDRPAAHPAALVSRQSCSTWTPLARRRGCQAGSRPLGDRRGFTRAG